MNTTLPSAKPLSPDRIEYYKEKKIPKGWPVRFMVEGRAVASLQTGELHTKGINVIHQTHYWCFDKETSKELAKEIGATPIFSETN